MAKDILITRNVGLNDTATDNSTSTVNEPSVAAAGPAVFMSGNWFASASTDDCATWSFMDPETFLPPTGAGFCCDQLVLFDGARNIWIWILQYRRSPDGTNVFRIAVTDTADFPTTGWHWWDIGPGTLDPSWTDVWLDYPDAAISAGHLYVTFNVFRGNDWQRSVVMKFPLDVLASGGNLGFRWWGTNQAASLRLTQQGAPSAMMYFASNSTGSNSRVRVFSWPDGDDSIRWWNVPVTPWSHTISSIAPNGRDWLQRCDQRITGGAIGSDLLTFAWTAGADANRPHAYCRTVVIDRFSMQVVDNPDIWSQTRAWAYPAISTNASGTLGVTAFYGGGDRNPGMVVGARDTSDNRWVLRYARIGTDSPSDGKWGDYLNCRPDVPNSNNWVASGFTLEGSEARTSIVPRVVRFSMIDTAAVV
ncbi:MAG: hypothetical protein AB3N12_03560 [Ruegeria sp.]